MQLEKSTTPTSQSTRDTTWIHTIQNPLVLHLWVPSRVHMVRASMRLAKGPNAEIQVENQFHEGMSWFLVDGPFFDKFSSQWTLEEKVSMAKFECEQMILFATKAGWQTWMQLKIMDSKVTIWHVIWYAKDHDILISILVFAFCNTYFNHISVVFHVYHLEILWSARLWSGRTFSPLAA